MPRPRGPILNAVLRLHEEVSAQGEILRYLHRGQKQAAKCLDEILDSTRNGTVSPRQRGNLTGKRPGKRR